MIRNIIAAFLLFAIAGVATASGTPAPIPGNTAWILIATALVTMMAIPGLALFYGGLVRSKNVLSVLMQTMMIFSVLAILWVVFGYSLAFTGGSPFIGGLDKLFLAGVTPDSVAATFSKGVVIPELAFIAFQLTFAGITAALFIGSFAERVKFGGILAFAVLWFIFSYLPIAHMVWYWDGPDAITDAKSLEAVTAAAGWLWAKGALDFAGGTVVHINAGIAGLVGAIMLGRRVGWGRDNMSPHNLALVMVGAAMLWVGWFGFNAGSNLEATGVAALALLNTMVAAATATVSWAVFEKLVKGKASMLGAASGAVAGLVAITPAAGFVGIAGALAIGAVVSPICMLFVDKIKRAFGYDDSLDVFGIHGIGGIVGAVLTGVFVSPALGGTGVYDYVANAVGQFDMTTQVLAQLWAVGTAVIWSAVVSVIAFYIVDKTIGMRVSEESEREGLDTTSHGESAYHG